MHRVRFHVHKVDERRTIEDAMQDGKYLTGVDKKAVTSNRPAGSLLDTLHLSTTDYERAHKVAPGWDIYSLESEWREWIATKGKPEKPGPAFIAFCRQKYKRKGKP